METEPITEPGPRRSPAAERMRRHRQRRRDGLRCLVIELRETEIDVLVQKGLLKAERMRWGKIPINFSKPSGHRERRRETAMAWQGKDDQDSVVP
jgi:hypothetical protein